MIVDLSLVTDEDRRAAEELYDFLGYSAGIVDGEGCIDIQRQAANQRSHFIRITVRNTNKEVLLRLRELFGGDIQWSRPTSYKPNWKDSGAWRLSGRAAENVLFLVKPWLIIKKCQADLALSLASTKAYENIRKKVGAYRRLTSVAIVAGEVIRLQMKTLNRKGVAFSEARRAG